MARGRKSTWSKRSVKGGWSSGGAKLRAKKSSRKRTIAGGGVFGDSTARGDRGKWWNRTI